MPKAKKLLDHISTYRLENRLSQKEIHTKTDLSASAYSKLENGQRTPKLNEALEILSALNLPAIELIYWLSDSGVQFQELSGKDPHCYLNVLAALKENICSLELKHTNSENKGVGGERDSYGVTSPKELSQTAA